jgi:hypothetical protein
MHQVQFVSLLCRPDKLEKTTDNMIFQRFKNDSLARAHLLYQLGDGTTLARLLMARHDLNRGTLLVALPSTIKSDEVENFQWSLSGVKNAPSIELLQSLFTQFLGDSNCELLFQDTMESPSDPPSTAYPPDRSQKIIYREEVYWKLKGLPVDKEMLYGSFNPYSAFFHTSKKSNDAPLNLVDDDLERIALETVGIAVDAFDADSFLVWWREDLYPFPLSVAQTREAD